jgi:hypothetical protein
MRKIALLALIIFLATLLAAQAPNNPTSSNPLGGNLTVQDAGTCSTAGSFLWQRLPTNASTTTVNLSGTFSGTITVRESNNGGASWTTAGTQTSVGTSTYVTNGFTDICADLTTFTSGNFGVTLTTGVGVGVPALPGGSNTQVQYNNNGAFGGNAGLTFNGSATAPVLNLNGSVSGQILFGPGNGTQSTLTFGQSGPSMTASAQSGIPISISSGLLSSFIQSIGTNSVSGCTLSAAVGGASSGKFVSGTAGTCTVTITLPAVLNGWTCDAHDLTTAADANNVVQTAFTTTTATMSGTTASGDVITWKCQGW